MLQHILHFLIILTVLLEFVLEVLHVLCAVTTQYIYVCIFGI